MARSRLPGPERGASATTICEPSGDQAGAPGYTPARRRVLRLPDEVMTQSAVSPHGLVGPRQLRFARMKAIRPPAGDQVGHRSRCLLGARSMRVLPRPAALMGQISASLGASALGFPRPMRTYTILAPLGDRAGVPVAPSAVPVVSRRADAACGSRTQISASSALFAFTGVRAKTSSSCVECELATAAAQARNEAAKTPIRAARAR